MKYSTPEIVELGTAAALVQGVPGGTGDDVNPLQERIEAGLLLGLDD